MIITSFFLFHFKHFKHQEGPKQSLSSNTSGKYTWSKKWAAEDQRMIGTRMNEDIRNNINKDIHSNIHNKDIQHHHHHHHLRHILNNDIHSKDIHSNIHNKDIHLKYTPNKDTHLNKDIRLKYTPNKDTLNTRRLL